MQALTLECRTAWINAIRRKQWVPGSGARVCSVHFISGKPAASIIKIGFLIRRWVMRSVIF